jgi:hypothetical protein
MPEELVEYLYPDSLMDQTSIGVYAAGEYIHLRAKGELVNLFELYPELLPNLDPDGDSYSNTRKVGTFHECFSRFDSKAQNDIIAQIQKHIRSYDVCKNGDRPDATTAREMLCEACVEDYHVSRTVDDAVNYAAERLTKTPADFYINPVTGARRDIIKMDVSRFKENINDPAKLIGRNMFILDSEWNWHPGLIFDFVFKLTVVRSDSYDIKPISYGKTYDKMKKKTETEVKTVPRPMISLQCYYRYLLSGQTPKVVALSIENLRNIVLLDS